MPLLKNPRHEAFVQHRAAGLPAYKAYEMAGFKSNDGNAARLNGNERIRARLTEVLSEMAGTMAVTIESLAGELDQAIAIGHKQGQAAAICTAVMAKAKLFNLVIDRSVATTTHNYSQMTEEELRFELTALNQEIRSIKVGKPN